MDDSLIQKLDRCLLSGRPVLFTGAGFSLGAINGNNEPIPTGNGLKKMILTELLGYKERTSEFEEIFKATLSDVCSFAESEVSYQKLQDYIISNFQDCTPKSYHEQIATFPNWKRIYTVNIDDVFENAVQKGTIVVQNSASQFSYTRAKNKEYIKLHGCVRNRSERIVFSNQQYVDSMLNSTDYRFSSFARDMQIENFVIVGTEMNEINLDYYLSLFSQVSGKTSHGQLFFINPDPGLIFKAKVKKIGAQIIEWTAEEFAKHLYSLSIDGRGKNSHKIEDFLHINDKYEIDKKFKGYNSYLYFGQHPEYRDIIFDWDFINPEIVSIYNSVMAFYDSSKSGRLMLSMYGKSLTGKSTYLKRLAIQLVNDNVAVYDFCGKKFDVKDFCEKCKQFPEPNIALMVDNASFYYSEIKYLVQAFPMEKNLLVMTTARTYSHYRKRYCLVSESWFKEVPITGDTNSTDNIFAKNIAIKLDEKGLLGILKAKSFSDRVAHIASYADVESCLFSVTKGLHFQKRQLNNYYERKDKLGKGIDLLTQLAILYKLDIPYMPLEIVGLLYHSNFKHLLDICENFITINRDSNGISLRDSFLVPHLLKKMRPQKYIHLLREILVVISPQVVDGNHTYWNEMASTLMKCKLLRSVLHLPNSDVKNLLTDIKEYYDDDYNYWLQVGLSEQHDSDYELALNHFRQAESMSPSSYTVRNAIARNFLRQANEILDFKIAKQVHNEGVMLMKQLIAEREEFQVKAFSTHCLLFERIRFYRRNNFVPEEEILLEMYTMLKSVIDKDPDGPMSRHISNVFFTYIKDFKLSGKLPSFTMYDLKYFKAYINEEDLTMEDYVEDFEVD